MTKVLASWDLWCVGMRVAHVLLIMGASEDQVCVSLVSACKSAHFCSVHISVTAISS